MMREFKAQLFARWDEMVLILGLEAGFFIAAEIILAFLGWFDKTDNTVFQVGTLTALVVVLFVVGFMGIAVLPVHFNIAVSMGTARKRFMPVFFLVSFLQNLTAAGAVYLLSILETWILRTAYAEMELISLSEYIFQWKYILPACLGLVALNVFMGVLYMKLGKIAWTVLWVIWMLCFVGGPRVAHWSEYARGTVFGDICGAVVDIVSGFTESGILAGAVLGSAGLLAVSWIVLRRQEVRL